MSLFGRFTRVSASLLVLAACGGNHSARPVRPAQRIVSLAPAFTDLLFAIGAGDHVVGRTRWDEYPPQAADVPSVGDGLAPNVEAIVARRPDLVVFYESPSNAEAIARLEALGIRCVSIRLDRLADFRHAVDTLADLAGVRRTADSALAAFDRDLLAATALPAGPSVPSVLVLAWDNPPIVIGGGSFQSELVELAGARNAFADIRQPSAQVSIETIVARDPDLVLVTGNTQPAFAERPEWKVVPAVRAHRFVFVKGSEFAWPSFRAPAAVRQLRAALEEAGR